MPSASGRGLRTAWRRRCSPSARPDSRAGGADDLARLVPEYVTLPRGVLSGAAGRRRRRDERRRAARDRGNPRVTAGFLTIRPMGIADLAAVQRIERASFTTPWPPQAYRQELETNRLAALPRRPARRRGRRLRRDLADGRRGAHHDLRRPPRYRRRRIGERLLLALLDLSVDRHAREATLEVRLSNLAARRLYEKYGFRPVGIRPRYYSDDSEDALIMTTEPLVVAGDASTASRGCGRRWTARPAPELEPDPVEPAAPTAHEPDQAPAGRAGPA